MSNPAQEHFDKTYITSTEIMREVGVSRTALLYARNRGLLPNSIVVNDGMLFMWEREPLAKYIEAWKTVLQARRGAAA